MPPYPRKKDLPPENNLLTPVTGAAGQGVSYTPFMQYVCQQRKLLEKKKNEKKNEKNAEEIQHDSFVGSMLQKCNIDLSDRIRETVINCCVYSSFLISYCLLQ